MNCQRLFTHLKTFLKINRFTNREFKFPCKTFATLNNYEKTVLPVAQKIPLIYTIQCRNYPKNRDKVKTGGKKIEIRDDMLAEAINVGNFKGDLQAIIDELKDQYIKQLSLRSAAGVIETLPVEYEGDEYTIQDLAQINRKNPKMLVLNLASFPQTIPTVIEVITKSGMNLNPQQDGTSICIPIPKVTREHRESLAKNAKTIFNKCKENIRDVQRKYLRKLDSKQSEGLSTEKVQLVKEQIMAVVNQYASIADKMREEKQKELLQED